MSRKGSNKIDIELTKQHHNYYGEEADPELARILAANKKEQMVNLLRGTIPVVMPTALTEQLLR